MGNETYIDVLVLIEASALFPPNFTMIGNGDFYTWYKFSLEKLVFLRISKLSKEGRNTRSSTIV